MKSDVPLDTACRVRELLNERSMTLSQLSKVSGVSPSTIRRAEERGTQLAVDTIYRICMALGISMSDFSVSRSARTDR